MAQTNVYCFILDGAFDLEKLKELVHIANEKKIKGLQDIC
jgi:hypothetical protein